MGCYGALHNSAPRIIALHNVGRGLVHGIHDDLEQKKVLGWEANPSPDDNAIVCRGAQAPLHS